MESSLKLDQKVYRPDQKELPGYLQTLTRIRRHMLLYSSLKISQFNVRIRIHIRECRESVLFFSDI